MFVFPVLYLLYISPKLVSIEHNRWYGLYQAVEYLMTHWRLGALCSWPSTHLSVVALTLFDLFFPVAK